MVTPQPTSKLASMPTVPNAVLVEYPMSSSQSALPWMPENQPLAATNGAGETKGAGAGEETGDSPATATVKLTGASAASDRIRERNFMG